MALPNLPFQTSPSSIPAKLNSSSPRHRFKVNPFSRWFKQPTPSWWLLSRIKLWKLVVPLSKSYRHSSRNRSLSMFRAYRGRQTTRITLTLLEGLASHSRTSNSTRLVAPSQIKFAKAVSAQQRPTHNNRLSTWLLISNSLSSSKLACHCHRLHKPFNKYNSKTRTLLQPPNRALLDSSSPPSSNSKRWRPY